MVIGHRTLDNNASTLQKGSFSQTKASPVTSLIHLMKLLTLGLKHGDFSNHILPCVNTTTVTKTYSCTYNSCKYADH